VRQKGAELARLDPPNLLIVRCYRRDGDSRELLPQGFAVGGGAVQESPADAGGSRVSGHPLEAILHTRMHQEGERSFVRRCVDALEELMYLKDRVLFSVEELDLEAAPLRRREQIGGRQRLVFLLDGEERPYKPPLVNFPPSAVRVSGAVRRLILPRPSGLPVTQRRPARPRLYLQCPTQNDSP
jgi:hypothetical protein